MVVLKGKLGSFFSRVSFETDVKNDKFLEISDFSVSFNWKLVSFFFRQFHVKLTIKMTVFVTFFGKMLKLWTVS